MGQPASRGVEFSLHRKLIHGGRPYAPWLRLHSPNHRVYDVLVGLDLATQHGDPADRHLRLALTILTEKRRAYGTWLRHRAHPDVSAETTFDPDTEERKPVVIEKPERANKWLTLQALRLSKRVEDAS